MEYRSLGRTGMEVSVVGFGCGNVGGLMIRGEHGDQVKAAARAMELGINYFDTASSYGDGQSEQNLGRVLNELSADVIVGTKVRLGPEDMGDIKAGVIKSVEDSLSRMNRPSVDLIQLHNRVATQRDPDRDLLSVEDVLGQVVDGFQALQTQGKVRFYGITGFGETDPLLRVIDSGAIFSTQSCYNLINPSSGTAVDDGFDLQDFGGLIQRAEAQGTGVLVIRVLAAGALTGVDERHPVAAPQVSPMGSSGSYSEDLSRAKALDYMVDDGHVENLVEAALRFPLGNSGVSTVLVGYSNMEHLEQAVRWMDRGPLPAEALERLPAIWSRQG
jgi:aryl-alcohol dehydrogenase-like predicted oxidoreductase